MRLREYLNEEISTTSVGELDADAVTDNKLLRVELKDNHIKKLVKFLEKKGASVDIDDGVATIDIPYEIDKSLMKQLSRYTI